MSYLKKIDVRWSDLDPNRHVANTAFSEYVVHTRMSYFAAHGFAQKDFARFNVGPAILHEEFFYVKEVMPQESVYVDFELQGYSEDRRFGRFSNSIFKEDGSLAVFNTAFVAWFNLKQRKITVPPPELLALIEAMPRSEDFRIIPKEELSPSPRVPYGKRIAIK